MGAEKEISNTIASSADKSFDEDIFYQTSSLLKDELAIAIDEYLEDAVSYIRGIEQGISDENISIIARNSHTLKSNSKNFGLMAVSHAASNINNLCEQTLEKKYLLKHAQKGLSDLKQSFSEGEIWLKKLLKKAT